MELNRQRPADPRLRRRETFGALRSHTRSQANPRCARSSSPSTAIFQAPRGALTGRHQLQEECLLRAVSLSKLPHDVAFPVSDRGVGGAGPRHGRPHPAPRTLRPEGAAWRGRGLEGTPCRRGRAAAGNPRAVLRALVEREAKANVLEAAPRSAPPGHRQKFSPEWGPPLLPAVIGGRLRRGLQRSFPRAYGRAPPLRGLQSQCSLTPQRPGTI